MNLAKLKDEDFKVARALGRVFGVNKHLHPHDLIRKDCVIRVPEKNPKLVGEGDLVFNNHYVKISGVSSRCYKRKIDEGFYDVIIEITISFTMGIIGVFSHVSSEEKQLESVFKKLPKRLKGDSSESADATVDLL